MKILIEAMHGMGDLVCILPMIKEIQTNYPNADITILVNKNSTSDILICSGIKFKSIKVIDAHRKRFNALLQCLDLRKEKFDLAIASANTPINKSKLIMSIIKAKRTAGIQYSIGKYYEMLNDTYHFVNAHYMALDQLGLEKHNYSPRLYANKKIVENIKKQ